MKPASRIKVESVRNGKEHEVIYNEDTGKLLKDEHGGDLVGGDDSFDENGDFDGDEDEDDVDSDSSDDDNNLVIAIMLNRTGTE